MAENPGFEAAKWTLEINKQGTWRRIGELKAANMWGREQKEPGAWNSYWVWVAFKRQIIGFYHNLQHHLPNICYSGAITGGGSHKSGQQNHPTLRPVGGTGVAPAELNYITGPTCGLHNIKPFLWTRWDLTNQFTCVHMWDMESVNK